MGLSGHLATFFQIYRLNAFGFTGEKRAAKPLRRICNFENPNEPVPIWVCGRKTHSKPAIAKLEGRGGLKINDLQIRLFAKGRCGFATRFLPGNAHGHWFCGLLKSALLQ